MNNLKIANSDLLVSEIVKPQNLKKGKLNFKIFESEDWAVIENKILRIENMKIGGSQFHIWQFPKPRNCGFKSLRFQIS